LLTQSRLLRGFVSLAKSSTGSLFLLHPDGVVRDCILTRGPRLAGWDIAASFHAARQVSG
jgi:hypothetical protein